MQQIDALAATICRGHLARWPVTIALCALSGGALLAQTLPLAPTSVQEFVDPDERISGNAIVGLAFIGASEALDPNLLYAFINTPPAGELNIEFNGIDGRYAVRAAYSAGSVAAEIRPASGPAATAQAMAVPLQLGELQHGDRLKAYTAETGAILLTDASGNHYPVRWGGAEQTDIVRVYLNAERTEAFFFADTPAGRKMTMCKEPTATTPPFKFNRICDVPATQIAAGPVQIQRRFGSRRLEPITLELTRHTTR